MIRLNLRRGESTWRFGKPSWSTVLDEPIDENRVLAMMDGARVCLLIHGYNVVDATDAYCMIHDQVMDLYDLVIGVMWPGSQFELGYWLAEQRADRAGRMLAEVFRESEAFSIDIEAHSCGCRVALEAVRQGLPVRNLILAGAAVDNELVHYDEKYGSALTTNVGCGIIAYSREDEVLKRAFRLSSAIKSLVMLKRDDYRALGHNGAETPSLLPRNVRQHDLSNVIHKHSGYKRSPDFYRIWRQTAA